MSNRREFKPRRRSSGNRDASLIVIATEGEKTERQYFRDLISPEYYQNARVHVHVIKRESSKSAPKHVIKSLDRFSREYRLGGDDELWMVIDTDNWPEAQLSAVAAKCHQKGYKLSVSNPCFELWLLLHVKDIDEYGASKRRELERNHKVSEDRTALERELVHILGSYNKSRPDTDAFLPYVGKAIERAEKLDEDSGQRWPQSLGTRVYLLVERILRD